MFIAAQGQGAQYCWCCARRSTCEDQALPLRGPLPLVPRAASPHKRNLRAPTLDVLCGLYVLYVFAGANTRTRPVV